MTAHGIFNLHSFQEKQSFLKQISARQFGVIPRSEGAQNTRIAKDKKVLERSLRRTPPFLIEESKKIVVDRAIASSNTRSMMKKDGLNPPQKIDWTDEDTADESYIRVTGDGDSFTFLTVLSEFFSKHSIFFSVISGTFVLFAGFTPLFKPWIYYVYVLVRESLGL